MTTEFASVMTLPVTLIVTSAPLMGILGSSLDCDKSADQIPTNGLLAACGSRCWAANMDAPATLRIVVSSIVVMNPSSGLDTAEPSKSAIFKQTRYPGIGTDAPLDVSRS